MEKKEFDKYKRLFHEVVTGAIYDYSCFLAQQCVERMVKEAEEDNTELSNRDIDNILIASFIQMRVFMDKFNIPASTEPYHEWDKLFEDD